MKSFSKEHVGLLRLLINSDKPLSSSSLSISLGVSQKTIRTYLEEVETELIKNAGAHIVSKSGSGICIAVDDKEKYKKFYEYFSYKYESNKQIVGSNFGDTGYLIRKILCKEDEYITIDELVLELYKSRKPIIKDLEEVEKFFARYHIILEKKAGCGLKKQGKESHIRIAMADSFMMTIINVTNDPFQVEYLNNKKHINQSIINGIAEYRISIAQKSIDKIGRIIYIGNKRNDNNHFLEEPYGHFEEIKDSPEYACARKIYKDLGYAYNEKEVQFLAILLITRRSLSSEDFLDIHKCQEACDLANKVIKEIYNKTSVDFSTHSKFRLDLARHLRGMQFRAILGLEKRSITKFKNKLKNTYFELSIIACTFIGNEFNVKINESEFYYFSYIFQNQMLLQSNDYKSRVLISSIEGKEVSKMISWELIENWKKYIDEIEIVDNYLLNKINLYDYDLLISDEPEMIKRGLNVHCLYVNSNLNNADYLNLKHYFETNDMSLQIMEACLLNELYIKNLSIDDKDRVLDLICAKINSYFNNEVDVAKDTFMRETISSSEIINSIAVPHSFTCFVPETKIVVVSLKKPITWNDTKCKMILYVANGKNEKIPFSLLSSIKEMIKNNDFAQDIIETNDFDAIIDVIHKWIERR